MGNINWGRVVLGGLLAGVVLNVYDFVLNGWLLMAQWNDAMRALGKGETTGGMIAWFVVLDFVVGIWLVWLYAAIRPRFGPGPKTAVTAGLAGWVALGLIANLLQLPGGLFPSSLLYWNLIGLLVAGPVAAVAGARFYQEA